MLSREAPEDGDAPEAMVGELPHANRCFLGEDVFAIHRQYLIEPDHMRPRRKPLEGAHHTVALDHAGAVALAILNAVGRVREHEVISLERHLLQALRIINIGWTQVRVD